MPYFDFDHEGIFSRKLEFSRTSSSKTWFFLLDGAYGNVFHFTGWRCFSCEALG